MTYCDDLQLKYQYDAVRCETFSIEKPMFTSFLNHCDRFPFRLKILPKQEK